MSAVLEYFVVDVFTREPFAGNPLAVVMNTSGLSTGQMQAIAREFNLSETTFVERRAAEIEAGEGVRVRIFTTEEELPFAGHPTLGTASVLKLTVPETVRDQTVTLAESVGPIPVRFTGEGLYGEMTQRDPEFGTELDRAEVARLCGLHADDLDLRAKPQVVSTGTAFAIVLVRSVEALGRLRVHQEEATPWLRDRGARWFYVMAPVANESPDLAATFRSRMQFYGGEDPATGSAAGCAISYLAGKGIVPSDARILVRQGVEMGRPSELYLAAGVNGVRVTDVRVAGSTMLVAKGQLFLS
jgi:trans-2,3-dihydro-3-hydroxyanthranilate isomerase